MDHCNCRKYGSGHENLEGPQHADIHKSAAPGVNVDFIEPLPYVVDVIPTYEILKMSLEF